MSRDIWFWAMVLELIREHDFQLIQDPFAKEKSININHGHQLLPSVYMLRNKGRNFDMIRLQCVDFTWSSVLARDIRHLSDHLEKFRKALKASRLNLHNFYIMAQPPFDIFQSIEEMEQMKEKKAALSTKSVFVEEAPLLNDEPVSVDNALKSKDTTIIDVSAASVSAVDVRAADVSAIDVSAVDVSTIDMSELGIDSEAYRNKLEIITQMMSLDEIKSSISIEEKKKEREFKRIFFYGRPVLTYLFIFVNLVLFLYMEWIGSSQDVHTLVQLGAKSNEHIIAGEYWRLITPMFLHIGLIHMTLNNFALYFLGTVVERIYGNIRFLAIYFISGISGTLASFAFVPNIAAGASGAIFGCFGALLYFGLKHRNLFYRTLGTDIIFILFFNLGIGFVIPMIDNYGHIGGLAGGFLASMIILLPHSDKRSLFYQRLLALLFLIVIMVSGLAYGFNSY